MTVEELRQFIYTIANKDLTGDLPTPGEFNNLMARAVEDKFRIEYGLREVQNNVYFQSSQNSTDALNKFLVATQLTAVIPGIFTLPTNYVHLSSLSHVDSSGKTHIIVVLNDDEWSNRLTNPVVPPSTEYPIAKFVSGSLIVYPQSITNINITYLRKPANPVWGYTVVNDEPTYNPATSTQIEFADIYHIDIARIILSYMGIQFRDGDLLQYGQVTKNQGS